MLSAKGQNLFDVAKGVLPRLLFTDKTQAEMLAGAANLFAAAWDQIDLWVGLTQILVATGIYLDQHAFDRGTSRQAGETDAMLRNRLRKIDDAVTTSAILAAVNSVLTSGGITASAALVQLRAKRAFFSTTQRAYFSRGYRVGSKPPANHIIVILPYGTPPGTVAAAAEIVRVKKAGGVIDVVETRGVP